MPDFTIEPNSILQATFWFEYQASVCLNVFHYRTDNTVNAVNGVAILTEFAEDMKNNIWTNIVGANYLRPLMNEACKLHKIRVQKVYPDRKWFIDAVVNQFGTEATGQQLPSDMQWCVSLKATRVGRGRTGAKHFTGMDFSQLDGASLDGAFLASAQLFAARLIATLSNAALGTTVTPVIWNAKHAATLSEIHNAAVQSEARVMRRRQLHLGI
jgi:hypothetical protein